MKLKKKATSSSVEENLSAQRFAVLRFATAYYGTFTIMHYTFTVARDHVIAYLARSAPVFSTHVLASAFWARASTDHVIYMRLYIGLCGTDSRTHVLTHAH